MRLACAILLLVGARAAGVAPAETLASAVPAEKKNPIDAVEATYGRVKQRWRDYLSKPKPKAADAPAEKSDAKPKDEPAPKPKKSWFQKPRQIIRGLLRALCATIVVLGLSRSSTWTPTRTRTRRPSRPRGRRRSPRRERGRRRRPRPTRRRGRRRACASCARKPLSPFLPPMY